MLTISKIDANFMRKHFIDIELKPALRNTLSPEAIREFRTKHPNERYMYLNVEEVLKQSEDQGAIAIEGSQEDWRTYRIIYKDFRIPYTTLWHNIQYTLIEMGFAHKGKARYKFEITSISDIAKED